MAVLLGLLVSLTYGTGDFFGGLASKRTPATSVVIGSFLVSTGLLVVATVTWGLVGDLPDPAARDLWLGAATGLVGPVALGLLYRGLATGRMSVVAPITAVVAAVVPSAWGIARGERPSAVALAGVAVALVAVVLISAAPEHPDHEPDEAHEPDASVVPAALGAGVGFGVVYVLLGSTTHHAGLWPLVVSRPLSVALATLALVGWARRRGTPGRKGVVPARDAWPLVAGAGLFDVTANATFLAATQRGLLSIVAVLSSLYPASTVVLARLVLHERLHRAQLAGLVLAALGVVAMASA
jgi:drug/metabolite transporter (DMT)-like permease